jgi:hypothetical protein
MMGDHWQWYKGLGYEGSTRVPMMAWGPGRVQGGRRVKALESHFDIRITVMDLAGAEYSRAHRPGKNLLALASGEAKREEVLGRYFGFYLCHDRWKYNYYPNGGYEELFDLENDPRELENLAGSQAHAAVRADLKKRAERWLGEYSAGSGLNGQGVLAPQAYRPPNDGWHHGHMPWESRVPPTVLEAQGRPVGWWWRTYGMDMSAMLAQQVANIKPGPRATDVIGEQCV